MMDIIVLFAAVAVGMLIGIGLARWTLARPAVEPTVVRSTATQTTPTRAWLDRQTVEALRGDCVAKGLRRGPAKEKAIDQLMEHHRREEAQS